MNLTWPFSWIWVLNINPCLTTLCLPYGLTRNFYSIRTKKVFYNLFTYIIITITCNLFPLLNRPSSSLFAVCMPSPRRVFANLSSSLPAKAKASSAYFPNLAHLATGTRETQLRPRSHPATWLPSVSFPVKHPDTSSNMRKSSVSLPRWAASFRICPEARSLCFVPPSGKPTSFPGLRWDEEAVVFPSGIGFPGFVPGGVRGLPRWGHSELCRIR